MGADLGERADDKGTFGERRVTKLAEALGTQGTLKEAERSAGSGDRGAGQGVGHRKHNRKQCGGRIEGSGLRIKGAWLRITRVGLRIRRARRKIEGAGRSGENPGARRSWRPRRGIVPEDEARKRRRGQGRGPAQGARTSPARPPARARPSGPTRARPHRPHGLLQQCPEPAQHDGGPARLAARLPVAAQRWRRRRPNGREAGPGSETPPLPEGSGAL